MPLISGRIDRHGAVVDVLVGVSGPRQRMLRRHGFPIPQPIPVRAMIDTGSFVTGFAPRVFRSLGIGSVGTLAVFTPSTSPDAPHPAEAFDVTLSVVANGAAHPFTTARVIAADCWLPDEGVEGLVGRDLLDHCGFQYWGPERTFTLAF